MALKMSIFLAFIAHANEGRANLKNWEILNLNAVKISFHISIIMKNNFDISEGFGFTFGGVLLQPLIKEFKSDKPSISLVASLCFGISSMFGPITGGLVNKFGLRPVCISGSIVAAVGLALSPLSINVPLLILFFGVIGGIGSGLISLPAKIAIGYYFETKRALATGISECGSGVGAIIFPPLATYLLNQYGWKTTLLITAGLCLSCIFFGALMRPLEEKKEAIGVDEKVFSIMS